MANLADGGFLRDSSTHALVVTGYGTELAYAETTSNQTGISTQADLTGLTIAFTAGARPVMVELFIPSYGQVTSTGLPTFFITDSSNVQIAQGGGYTVAAAGFGGGLIVKARLAANSGAYSLKARASTSAGTLSVQASATLRAYLRAVEV